MYIVYFAGYTTYICACVCMCFVCIKACDVGILYILYGAGSSDIIKLTLITLKPDTDSEVITAKINNKLNPIIALVIPMLVCI